MMLPQTLLLSLLPSILAMTSFDALNGKLDQCDKRYPTFKMALDIVSARDMRTIVETGTARNGDSNCGGDGCSTVIWSRFASGTDITVDSVDISPDAVLQSRKCVEGLGCTTVYEGDSVAFLRKYPKPIDFLYLDSFDFDQGNPGPSQEHHLKEIIAAYDKLHENSVVLVDDCGLAHGGKCNLVELFLTGLGWRVLMKNYQLLMITTKELVL